ncbi:MAG: hypothetical protein ABTQ34_03775 [Bdellovibrionales bacterium]
MPFERDSVTVAKLQPRTMHEIPDYGKREATEELDEGLRMCWKCCT